MPLPTLSDTRQVVRLYELYSGPSSLVPMTLRGLLRLSRDAGLRERARITSEDVQKVSRKKAENSPKTKSIYHVYTPVMHHSMRSVRRKKEESTPISYPQVALCLLHCRTECYHTINTICSCRRTYTVPTEFHSSQCLLLPRCPFFLLLRRAMSK